jgi:hypothetical protein
VSISAKICLALTKSPPLDEQLAQSARNLGRDIDFGSLDAAIATGESGAQGFGLR